MIGYNINVANVVAAMFTATGQDIACVHESSLGSSTCSAQPGGALRQHRAAEPDRRHRRRRDASAGAERVARVDGLRGAGQGARLAEIIAGYCLALDLSTLAAIASGQFAAAHEKLGRNRPVRWFEREELDAAFFEPMLRRSLGDAALT